MYLIMRVFPQNAVSFITGWMTRGQFPTAIAQCLNRLFVKIYGIDMSEAEHPIASYRTIEDVFTRRLKPGLRPIEGEYVSPADGYLVYSNTCLDNQAIQVKEWRYDLQGLVCGTDRELTAQQKAKYTFTFAQTTYLAPHNYHRVHSPFTGTLKRLRYIPGKLWPVNERFVGLVPHLFLLNERLVFEYEWDDGAVAAVVMVGAFNVGRITSPFLKGFCSNAAVTFSKGIVQEFPLMAAYVKVGDEIGTFMLGSTVVVALNHVAEQRFRPRRIGTRLDVRVGRSLSAKQENE